MELRGIVGAAEETAAIAALLGHQQRLAGVLPVHRSEAREAPDERLRAADRCLDFAEVDASYAARGNHVARHWEAGAVEDAVLGAAETLEALARRDVELIDAEPAIGPVEIGLHAHAAQLVVRRRVDVAEDRVAVSVV